MRALSERGRHVRAIVLLPFMVTIVVPALLVWHDVLGGPHPGWGFGGFLGLLPVLLGLVVIGFGLTLMTLSIALFARVGKGTLAPWDPTVRLVVQGVYRHVRNPMISGVLFVLLGEAILLGSFAQLAWFGCFLGVNAIYLPLGEEPGLLRRFGADYARYKAAVPRWVPRRTPWRAPGHGPEGE